MSDAYLYAMIDCETLSVATHPHILSIGATIFTKDEIKDAFYAVMDGSKQPGADIDVKTVMWWLGVGSDALAEVVHNDMAMPLPAALIELSSFLHSHGPLTKVFSNGATADLVWLRSAYTACNQNVPWPFWQEGCYRTLRDLVPHEKPTLDVPHHALEDATHQTRIAMAILNKLAEIQ